MPANLTPQYHEAEEAYKKATTVEEKIAALEEMLAIIPKHKGTEKLQADIKKRLSKLRAAGEKKSSTSRYDPFRIERQGAGQVALVGLPNTGKSALVAALTRANTKVADYPFTTSVPIAGMMPFQNIYFQLVDTPPVTADTVPAGLAGVLRSADILLLLVDAGSDDCLQQLEDCLEALRKKRVLITEGEAVGNSKTPEQCLLLANKCDLPGSEERVELLEEMAPAGMKLMPVSTASGHNLENLRQKIFQMAGVVRVYTRAPGKEPDLEKPFVLPAGSTVLDLAVSIHKDFARTLKSARVWGSVKFDGQSVPREFVLQDQDIVELHV